MTQESPVLDFVTSRQGRLVVFVGMIGSTIWVIGYLFKHKLGSYRFDEEDWAWLIVGAVLAFVWFGLLALAGSWALRPSSGQSGEPPPAKPTRRDEGK